MTRTKPFAKWSPIDASALPLPISLVYTRRGTSVAKVLAKPMVCGWDSATRMAYKVTSSTGNTVQWTPSSRALTSWDPKLVRQ